MSVDLKFISTSKASRKSITNDSQYFTVFLQAVLNYRALLRTEHTASKKLTEHIQKQQGSNGWACLLSPACKKGQSLQTPQQTPCPHLTLFLLKSSQIILPAAGSNCKSREFAWEQHQQDNKIPG